MKRMYFTSQVPREVLYTPNFVLYLLPIPSLLLALLIYQKQNTNPFIWPLDVYYHTYYKLNWLTKAQNTLYSAFYRKAIKATRASGAGYGVLVLWSIIHSLAFAQFLFCYPKGM